MSNTISLHSRHENVDEWLTMGNGGTSAFLDVLVLSGSYYAKTKREESFVIFLAEKDQSVRGIGTVGFDISELPWSRDEFQDDKEFMISVINGSRNKIGWEKLNYKPNVEYIYQYLDKFEWLINSFNMDDIDHESVELWLADLKPNDGKRLCSLHDTLFSYAGCLICNNSK